MNKCIDGLARDGFTVLKGVLPGEILDTLRDSIASTALRHSTAERPLRYVGGLLARNRDIAPYLAHPVVAEICAYLFGPHCRISSVAGVVSEPGVERGDLHADWPHKAGDASCMRGPFADSLVHLVTIWMLTDFTAQNGGTIVRPGSHRPGGDGAGGRDEVHILGRAGDVALLDARTWHAVAPNVSRRPRVAVIVRYAPWWLNLNPLRRGSRDREVIVDRCEGSDPYVVPLSAAQFSTLPAEVQPLLYSMVE